MILEGIVYDEAFGEMPGAHVYFVDALGNEITSLGGTSTNTDGSFTLEAPTSGHIQASYVGFENQTINFNEATTYVTFSLTPDENVIGEATVYANVPWWKEPKYIALSIITLIALYFIYKKYGSA